MPDKLLSKLSGLLLLLFLASGIHAQDSVYRRPDFSLPDLDGKERSISEWDGRAMIINFWATWCVPCKREIPLLNQIDAEYEDTDLQVLGIAIDKPDNVRKFLTTTPMSYPSLVEENRGQKVVALFTSDPMVLPYTVFLDHAGRVFWLQVEEIHRAETDVILDFIRRVREGELTYEQAQLQLVDAVVAAASARE
jgi:thiol-disulfide isomerase/thioredoxin